MEVKIRKLRMEDLDRVLEISETSFSQPWPKSEFEKHLEESFAAEENGEIVGFIVGKISDKIGIIKSVAVDPDYRGKGIGESLMEHILKHFAEEEVKKAAAHSRIHNKAGCAFLKSFGFEIVETIENYYPNGDDAYLMKREL